MSVTEPRSTRIAVFIDFDNVEIGVKTTIGAPFDIGLVLEAIKERGEIVTKIAYSDWKRAGDYSRLLTQHAIRMVQRNVTPGGDKNGADITMALDALEMAFTHDHINAFVIVGGDSDFISLVEKLKQYGKKVIVVGGRQFTSVTMQKNCHEFIAYENLIGGRGGRAAGRGGRVTSDISKALPIVRRALKVLSEREVAPQLGLLKSTLLQLDSTFSEREYGASSFRDFMEKVAQTGAVTLKHAGRSMLVELREDGSDLEAAATEQAGAPAPAATANAEVDEEEALPRSPMTMQDGIRAVQQAFSQASPPPRWPLYVRQAKQFLKNAIPGFDERQYGFASVVDLLRAAGKEGVLRIDRDRHGAVRVFPGASLAAKPVQPPVDAPVDLGETVDVTVPSEQIPEVVDTEPVDVPPAPAAAAGTPPGEPEPVTEAIAEPPPADEGGEPEKPAADKTTRRRSAGTARRRNPQPAARAAKRKTGRASARKREQG